MREGKLKDTIMDKLANRLLAQEPPRASAMPDTDEGLRSNEQVQEYQRCLAETKKATLELNKAKNQMVDVLKQQLDEQIQECNQCLTEVKRVTHELNGTKEQIEKLLSENLAKIQEMQATNGNLEEIKQLLADNENTATDNVHKECVKVYRNVQAIVVEECAKQTETMVSAIAKSKSKANLALIFSIIAAVAAVGGVALQVLTWLHII